MSNPIEPKNYLHGVNVVQILDFKIARGKTVREYSKCRHRNLTYDSNERRIYCHDCEHDIEAFDAFLMLVEFWDSTTKSLEHREQELIKAEQHALVSRAAKAMDDEWRKKSTVPLCPHCKAAIMPEDVLPIPGRASKELVNKLRDKQKVQRDG